MQIESPLYIYVHLIHSLHITWYFKIYPSCCETAILLHRYSYNLSEIVTAVSVCSVVPLSRMFKTVRSSEFGFARCSEAERTWAKHIRRVRFWFRNNVRGMRALPFGVHIPVWVRTWQNTLTDFPLSRVSVHSYSPPSSFFLQTSTSNHLSISK